VEKKIADYLLKHPEIIINMTVAEISEELQVAHSSIVRFCQKIGFDGFSQLKINLARNLKKPEELIGEDIDRSDDPFTITNKVFSSSIRALKDTIKMLDRTELARAADALLNAKRIEFYGVGTSAPIATDAYYRFMRIGLPAYTATDPHVMRISANMLDAGCVAVGVSHTGRTRDTVSAIRIAKDKSAKTICITSFTGSPIFELSDIKLVTSTAETKIMKEAVSSRIAQIALIDGLYACIALRKYDKTLENIGNMAEILNEMRY